MKRIYFLFILAFSFVAINLSAQDFDISDYLKGAVPTVDGKVVFSKSFEAPNVSRDSLMSLTEKWINSDGNRSSRVLLKNDDEGTIVGGCRDKLVFKSLALYIDQADINYYLQAICSDGQVKLEIFRISYMYDHDERFSAEELIPDEVSLNKKQTNIVKSSLKWRVKTVDFANNIFKSYKSYLARNTQQ